MLKHLSTSEFAAAIGVSESSVRRLADHGELRIHRTQGGHRKIPVAEALRYVRTHQASVQRPELLGLVKLADDAASGTDSERLLRALTQGHYKSVIGLLQSMYLNRSSIAEICDGPIREAMAEIGNFWPQNRRSIFIEHRATVLCVRALCQIRMALPEIADNPPTAMGGAPQDDPYLLPSLMASLVLHECGYDEVNLGPNTPIDVLADSVEDEQPNVVWLAITNPIRSRSHHREIEKLAEIVAGYDGIFLVGGRGAESYDGMGAQFCESMSDIERLVQSDSEF